MSGEYLGETSAQQGEESRDTPTGSGWTTTKQAAKVLGVSRRSVQGYVRRGLLEATEEGEGVNKRFLVSIDSLNEMLARRSRETERPAKYPEPSGESANPSANVGEGLRHAIERLEVRTAEATELRIRLELTERAESTLRAELEEERRRREEIERENEDLRRELESLEESAEAPQPDEEASDGAEPRSGTEGEHAAAERPSTEEEPRRRSWWRAFFGIGE